MGEECPETAFVVAREPIDREAAVAGAGTSEAVLIHVGFFGQRVDGRKVIFHVLSAIVAANLLKPLLPEAGEAAAVGGDHDIAVGSHHLQVPAVGPKLAYHALGAALTIEQRGVFLRRVEVGRIHHPGEHLLPVGGLDASLFHVAHAELGKNLLVFERELGSTAGSEVYRIDLGRLREGLAGGDQVAVPKRCHGDIVVIPLGEGKDLPGGNIGHAELGGSFHG